MPFRRSQDGGEPRARFGWRRAPAGETDDAATAELSIDETHDEAKAAAPARAGRLDGLRAFVVVHPYVAAVTVLVIAVAFVSVLTYYSARQFTRRAADTRASMEAESFAKHSSTIATGDAFNGYLQMLRYADDPVLRSKASTEAQRREAMQQMVYLNTNKLSSLAVVDRAGIVLASTDSSVDVRASEAFSSTRADLHPANSDILLPEPGQRGYVEFTAPLKDVDGTVWAILYGRADPERLWASTLRASVDGGRNVIINSEGQFSAGVPDELLKQSWRGVPLGDGRVRADVAGIDSICGLGAIGQGTQIDHGWNVASCLPASLIQTEADRAMGKQGLVTLAGAVLTIVVAGAALKSITSLGSPSAPRAASDGAEPAADATAEAEIDAVVEANDEPSTPAAPVYVADVDALALIEAFERRNERLAERLRETVRARLIVAAAQVDEAFRVSGYDGERAAALHATAMGDFDAVGESELRALGQEMYPSLIRLGLPSALRALAKELSGELNVAVDVAPDVDAVAAAGGRVSIEPRRRLALYRAIRASLLLQIAAGASGASLRATRSGDLVELSIMSDADELGADGLDASSIAIEAYGGTLSVRGGSIVIELPAPHDHAAAADADEDVAAAWREHDTVDPEDDGVEEAVAGAPAAIRVVQAPPDDDESLIDALRSLRERLRGVIALELALDEHVESGDRSIDGALQTELFCLVGDAARLFASGGAGECSVALSQDDGSIVLSVTSAVAAGDSGTFSERATALESLGGTLEVASTDAGTTVTARAPMSAEERAPLVRLQAVTLRDEVEDDGEDDAADEVAPPDVDALLALADDDDEVA